MKTTNQSFEMIAKSLPGFEQVLADELVLLGAKNVKPIKRGVRYYGDTELLYLSNFQCYTALKILKPIHHFTVRNENELYIKSKGISWNKYLSVEHTFSIETVVFSSHFKHSGFVGLKVKDAIADFFREQTGRRPDVDPRNPDITVNVHINNQDCTISLDSTGKSLHKRGYRKENHEAPLNEVFAAGILRLAGWSPGLNLLDPMCGSGTIVIEAGLMNLGIKPGSLRRSFAFQNWLDYNPGVFRAVKQKDSYLKPGKKGEIRGSDSVSRFVSMARTNAETAGLKGKINILKSSFESMDQPWPEGMIIMNPPYGERMQTAEINSLYKNIGDTLKKNYAGYEVWILSSNKEALKNIGLQTSKKITLYNGSIEVKFQKYVIYKGSKKPKKM